MLPAMPDPTHPPRRFPPPWTVEETATESFYIRGEMVARRWQSC
jgi:hypothetical protein